MPRLAVLALLLAVVGSVSPGEPAFAAPAILDFDTYPGGDWEVAYYGASSSVSEGMLTIDAPAGSYYEFRLEPPNGPWHQHVSNSRGWVIETRLQVDPATEDHQCWGSVSLEIWAHDGVNLVLIGFATDEICIKYPDMVRYPMDTTDGFHVYRIESRLDTVKVYVDGYLAIDHVLSSPGGGTDVLMFGDGSVVGGKSLSYWDYFWYEVFPPVATIALPPPGGTKQLFPGCNAITLTFIDGTACETAVRAVTPAELVESLWRYDAAVNSFQGFSPAVPEASDLLTVNFQDPVFICLAGTGPASPFPPAK